MKLFQSLIKGTSSVIRTSCTKMEPVTTECVLPGVKRCLSDVELPDNKKICTDPTLSDSKIRRRKVALLLGYSGQGYFGMQRNHGFKTVEEDLFIALKKLNLITDENFAQVQTFQFQRAARTDKGVSAACQVVSLKLPENATVELINEHLPEQIRVFSIKRVTKGFNSKTTCDARTYSYTLPTFSFDSSVEFMNEEYRITNKMLTQLHEIQQMFVGSHNYHNFTSKKKFEDPSAKRYIISFTMDEPFVAENLEFITLKIKGQSFMLHQIRKMVGIVLAISRGLTTKELITRAWGKERLDIPRAPGLGLVLEEVHYDRYDMKYGKDGMHEPLTWLDVKDKIEEFKKKFIYPVIIKTEMEEKSMALWLETLSYHSYDVREDRVPSLEKKNTDERENSEVLTGIQS